MVGQSKLRWGGVGGRELPFDPVTITNGTKAGVMWRKNPVPRAWKTKDGKWGHGSNHLQTGVGFQPVRFHTPVARPSAITLQPAVLDHLHHSAGIGLQLIYPNCTVNCRCVRTRAWTSKALSNPALASGGRTTWRSSI